MDEVITPSVYLRLFQFRDFKQGTEFGLIMEFWGCPRFMKTKPPKQSPEKKTGQEALAAIAAWHNAKQQVEPSLRFFEKTVRFHIHPTSNFPKNLSNLQMDLQNGFIIV